MRIFKGHAFIFNGFFYDIRRCNKFLEFVMEHKGTILAYENRYKKEDEISVFDFLPDEIEELNTDGYIYVHVYKIEVNFRKTIFGEPFRMVIAVMKEEVPALRASLVEHELATRDIYYRNIWKGKRLSDGNNFPYHIESTYVTNSGNVATKWGFVGIDSTIPEELKDIEASVGKETVRENMLYASSFDPFYEDASKYFDELELNFEYVDAVILY